MLPVIVASSAPEELTRVALRSRQPRLPVALVLQVLTGRVQPVEERDSNLNCCLKPVAE